MFVNVGPAASNISESVDSLAYGDLVKNITNEKVSADADNEEQIRFLGAQCKQQQHTTHGTSHYCLRVQTPATVLTLSRALCGFLVQCVLTRPSSARWTAEYTPATFAVASHRSPPQSAPYSGLRFSASLFFSRSIVVRTQCPLLHLRRLVMVTCGRVVMMMRSRAACLGRSL
jgi:hypothetical protein